MLIRLASASAIAAPVEMSTKAAGLVRPTLALGWAFNEPQRSRNPREVLQKVVVGDVDQYVCAAAAPEAARAFDSLVCVTGRSSGAGCHLDLGGPLLAVTGGRTDWLVSVKANNPQACYSGKIIIFTAVTSMRSWIDRVVDG
jgi:secreted trypsin-like serine protease